MGEKAPGNPGGERLLRRAVLAVSLLVGVSALWGIADSVLREPRVWGLLGFESVTLVAAVLGVSLGMGKPREAPGLGTVCVGATFFAAATLGRFSAIVTRSDATVSEGQAVGRLVRDPFFEGRLLAAIVLGVVALLFALGNDRGAWRKLGVGVGLALPVFAAAAWLVVGSGLEWALAPVESAWGIVRIIAVVVGAVALAVLTAVSVHFAIRAFELRLPPWPMEKTAVAKSGTRETA